MVLLLGAMEITVPSLIQAIANRPRDDDWEEEEEDYVEPAVAVVNHIANRQIEHKRQRRQKLAEEKLIVPQVQVLSGDPEAEGPMEEEEPEIRVIQTPPVQQPRPTQKAVPAQPVMVTPQEPFGAPQNASWHGL